MQDSYGRSKKEKPLWNSPSPIRSKCQLSTHDTACAAQLASDPMSVSFLHTLHADIWVCTVLPPVGKYSFKSLLCLIFVHFLFQENDRIRLLSSTKVVVLFWLGLHWFVH